MSNNHTPARTNQVQTFNKLVPLKNHYITFSTNMQREKNTVSARNNHLFKCYLQIIYKTETADVDVVQLASLSHDPQRVLGWSAVKTTSESVVLNQNKVECSCRIGFLTQVLTSNIRESFSRVMAKKMISGTRARPQ